MGKCQQRYRTPIKSMGIPSKFPPIKSMGIPSKVPKFIVLYDATTPGIHRLHQSFYSLNPRYSRGSQRFGVTDVSFKIKFPLTKRTQLKDTPPSRHTQPEDSFKMTFARLFKKAFVHSDFVKTFKINIFSLKCCTLQHKQNSVKNTQHLCEGRSSLFIFAA